RGAGEPVRRRPGFERVRTRRRRRAMVPLVRVVQHRRAVAGPDRSRAGEPMSTVSFGRETLPLGVFRPPGAAPRIGAAIDDQVIDLAAAAPDRADVFDRPSLNAFLAL